MMISNSICLDVRIQGNTASRLLNTVFATDILIQKPYLEFSDILIGPIYTGGRSYGYITYEMNLYIHVP